MFTSAMHPDVTLNQAFGSFASICAGIAAGIGSYVGYLRMESR